MALTFNPATGLVAPSTADIRAEVAAAFVTAFAKDGLPPLDTAPETPAGQLIDSITAMVADKDAEILYLANQFNPITASGVWQAALGQIYFLTPTVATARVALCQCTGLPGTVIAAGSIIQCTADQTQWAATGDYTIPQAGTVDVQFQCTTMEVEAVGAGTLTKIVTVTPGWDSVTNEDPSTAGAEAESQLAFEKRRYNSVAINGKGSVSALYAALASIPNVLDVLILENDTSASITEHGVTIPAHSIWITVEGGTATEIAAAIYRNKDAGCGTAGGTTCSYIATDIPASPVYTYQYCTPTPVSIGITVTIDNTLTTPGEIATLLKDAIIKNFTGETAEYTRCGAGQDIYSSRFYADCVAAGAEGLVSITLCKGYDPDDTNTWASQISMDADEFPTIDADNIIIVNNT